MQQSIQTHYRYCFCISGSSVYDRLTSTSDLASTVESPQTLIQYIANINLIRTLLRRFQLDINVRSDKRNKKIACTSTILRGTNSMSNSTPKQSCSSCIDINVIHGKFSFCGPWTKQGLLYNVNCPSWAMQNFLANVTVLGILYIFSYDWFKERIWITKLIPISKMKQVSQVRCYKS